MGVHRVELIERRPTMKKQIKRIVAIAVIGLVAFFATANRVQAQPAFKGQFTLTNDVAWNGAELPAGNYEFTLDSTAMPAKILLHGPNGYMFVLTTVVSEKDRGEASNLTVERRAGTRYISDLYIAELGMDLRYRAPKLNEKLIAQGPTTVEHIAIAMNGK
jgi:hypothetical protein